MTKQKPSPAESTSRFCAAQGAAQNLDAMLDLYADDAEMCIVIRDTPPSSPRVLRGKEEIAEYLMDVHSRDMKHSVGSKVVGEDRVAFNVV